MHISQNESRNREGLPSHPGIRATYHYRSRRLEQARIRKIAERRMLYGYRKIMVLAPRRLARERQTCQSPLWAGRPANAGSNHRGGASWPSCATTAVTPLDRTRCGDGLDARRVVRRTATVRAHLEGARHGPMRTASRSTSAVQGSRPTVRMLKASMPPYGLECLGRHWFLDLDDAREKVEERRTEYNEVRPHSAIGDRTQMSLIHRPPAIVLPYACCDMRLAPTILRRIG